MGHTGIMPCGDIAGKILPDGGSNECSIVSPLLIRVFEACDVCPVCSMQPCDPVECANYYFVNRKIDCSPFLLSPSV